MIETGTSRTADLHRELAALASERRRGKRVSVRGLGAWLPSIRWGNTSFPSRGAALLLFLGCGLLVPACVAAGTERGGQQAAAPIERRPPPPAGAPAGSTPGGAPQGGHRGVAGQPAAGQQFAGQRFAGQHGEHLTEWISRHSNLSLTQQEEALGQEPGFRELPMETQQRYRNRLAQLDAMNPERRQRLLARNELMERLTPQQRAQVRGALGQLGGLPLDQRRAVAQTFRALRDLPPEQRFAAMNSGRMGPPLNPVQRAVLDNLLTVAPILPFPNRPARPPGLGGQQTIEPGMPR